MIVLIAVAAVVLGLWWYLMKPLNYWSDRGVNQTKPWILLGDSWTVIFRRISAMDFVESIYNLFPNERYVGWYNLGRPALMLKDPELIKKITVKDFDFFVDHPPFLDPDADPLWSKSLLSLTGDRWRQMRNVVSPTFTSSKIKTIFHLMVETAERFVQYFDTKNEEVIEVEVKETFARFTNDIIATTAFGVSVDSLQDKQNTFYQMGKRISDFSGLWKGLKFFGNQTLPTLFKFLGVRFLDKTAANYFTGVIDETITVREEKNIVRPDLINILLEARQSQLIGKPEGLSKRTTEISNLEIASQVVIFFFGGFDTVSTAMTFGSYELATNKDVQDRLREEIRKYAKYGGKVTYETIQNMTYLDMVVSEIMRKWPPFPFLDRICTKPYTIEPTNPGEKPVHIPLNQHVRIPVYALQRDPKYFPDPEKFDPERFSEKNTNNIVPYTYLPFGIGPRICIANRFALVEIKAMFFHLLLKYEIVPTKKTQIPLVLEKEILPTFYGGCWLGLKRIKN